MTLLLHGNRRARDRLAAVLAVTLALVAQAACDDAPAADRSASEAPAARPFQGTALHYRVAGEVSLADAERRASARLILAGIDGDWRVRAEPAGRELVVEIAQRGQAQLAQARALLERPHRLRIAPLVARDEADAVFERIAATLEAGSAVNFDVELLALEQGGDGTMARAALERVLEQHRALVPADRAVALYKLVTSTSNASTFAGWSTRLLRLDQPAIDGTSLSSVTFVEPRSLDPHANATLAITLDDAGTRRLREMTRRYLGGQLAFVLDDEIVAMPHISEIVPTGEIALEFESRDAAVALRRALMLSRGPLELELISQRQVRGDDAAPSP